MLTAWPRFGAGAVPVKDLYQDKTELKRINSYESEWREIAGSTSALRRIERTNELFAQIAHVQNLGGSFGGV